MGQSELFDDVWGSDTEEINVIHKDIGKLRDQHSKRGYLDGIVGSKEVNLQQGFDDGFPLGAQLGHEVGLIIGRLQGLNQLYGSHDESLAKSFKDAKLELKINHVLNKNAFDENYDLLMEDRHELVDKWKQITLKYCEQYNVKLLPASA